MKRAAPTPCPCDPRATYEQCCGRYIEGGATADTAQALMRSRYSALVLEKSDYLLATWHATTRPPAMQLDQPPPRWLGLEIRADESIDSDHAVVEFVARFRVGGRAQRLHERSRFVREQGRWYYVAGDMLGPTSA
jgi:SEC-C motif domain protein